jgi:hypothetical protein
MKTPPGSQAILSYVAVAIGKFQYAMPVLVCTYTNRAGGFMTIFGCN